MTATILHAIGGKVAVEMTPEASCGDLLIPDRAQRPTTLATVISEPIATTAKGVYIVSPEPGTKVLVHREDGIFIEDRSLCKGQIRVYGHFCANRGEAVAVAWWHSILLNIDTMTPTGDKVLIRHIDENKTEGGIWLTDKTAKQGAYGKVVGVGPLAFDVHEGDTVCYDPRSEISKHEDCVIVPLVGLNYVKCPIS